MGALNPPPRIVPNLCLSASFNYNQLLSKDTNWACVVLTRGQRTEDQLPASVAAEGHKSRHGPQRESDGG